MRLSRKLSILLLSLLCRNDVSAEVRLSHVPDSGIQPQAVTGADGTLHLIYFKGDAGGGDIFYATRKPGAKAFSKPVRINRARGTASAIGNIRGAQMAVGRNGSVHVVWNGMGKGAEAAFDSPNHKAPLLYARIKPSGDGFEPERNVIDYAYGLDGGSAVAADPVGNVYIFWHAPSGEEKNEDEAHRRVFMVHSSDNGQSFSRESAINSEPTGACACCGMRAFANTNNSLYLLFRSAAEMTNRSELLLGSHDRGASFQKVTSEPWTISSCPMSSAFISSNPAEVLAASESYGRVFLLKVDARTGKTMFRVFPETKGKYPVTVENDKGEILLAWAEGTAWNRGGRIAWRIYNAAGAPLTEPRTAEKLPTWSFPAATVTRDGAFEIFY